MAYSTPGSVSGREMQAKATYHAIVNETAGGGRCAKLAPAALDGLRRRGVSLQLSFTERSGHARELARRAAMDGQRRFLAVGGDGTANEIVNGLIDAGVADVCELGTVPLGTGNSFLRDFGITSVEAATDAIVSGHSGPIDVLRLTHEDGVIHFINTMGTGFVAAVGALTNERFKPLGTAGYVAAVLACVVRLRYERNTLRYADTIDDAKTVLSAFSNSQYTGGGMRMAPDARVDDGLLDVVRAGPLGRLALITAFPRIFAGTHVALEEVWTGRANRVDFIDPSVQPALVDGELFHLRPLSIDVLPSALRFIA